MLRGTGGGLEILTPNPLGVYYQLPSHCRDLEYAMKMCTPVWIMMMLHWQCISADVLLAVASQHTWARARLVSMRRVPDATLARSMWMSGCNRWHDA